MSTAKLTLDGKDYEFPVVVGSEGEVGIDIAALRAKTGAITLDDGYGNTGSCKSAITFIDGDEGILRYRGYPIEELEAARFTEVAHLLVYGHLPNEKELAAWREMLTRHSLIHEDMKKFFEGFSHSAHPMAILSSMVASLSTYYPGEDVDLNIVRLLAKAKTIAAFSYKKSIGQPFIYPINQLSYTENFLHMMFAVPAEPYRVSPVLDRALNLLLILHADHEQNCSTSTVRLVGSSQANLFASVSAGINALFGPLHGGANQAVLEMLERIQGAHISTEDFMTKVKNKEDGVRLMGFGHRVYKNYDPRAAIIKKTADDVLGNLGHSDELLEIAMRLEEIALNDDYFIERKLYPNVDFYSGLIYEALNLPTEMFTVMFAIPRTSGWIAQWLEMVQDEETKIARPRQIYTGSREQSYVPIENREKKSEKPRGETHLIDPARHR